MTRLLLIGNSHLAAFRKGWDLIADAHPSVTIDFFAQPGPEYYLQRVDPVAGQYGALNEALFTEQQLTRLDNYNGKRVMDLTVYDQIMVIGNQHGFMDILKLLAHRDVAGLRQTDGPHLLSHATFDAIVQDLAAAFQPDPGWARLDGAPVTFHAMPRPAETAFEKVDPESNIGLTYAKIQACSDGLVEAFATLGQTFQTLMQAQGLRFLEQPKSTYNTYGLSLATYNAQLENFTGRTMRADTDYHHMNGDYGALCLCAAFPDILPRQHAA